MNAPRELPADDPSRRLEQAERLLACFQKAVGHELPNQLVALAGLLQVLELEEGERLGADGRDYLHRARGAAGRMHALVAGLAEAVRVWRSATPAEDVSLAEAVKEAAAEVKKLFPETVFEYHLPETAPVLHVPRPALRLVLVHLLKNAAQAAVPERPPNIAVGARRVGVAVEFWVADRGRGLSAERRRRLFEPFPGSDGPTAGTGLGLFLVRLLVDAWGGTVCVESVPGEGTTCTITAPGPQAAADSRPLRPDA